MGRWFIKKYYQYSPSMAYFIEQNPFWKSSTRVVLSSLLFIWDNPWPLVLLILLVLPMARGLTVFILFLFLLFPQWAQANIAISNYFEDIAPDNPSLLLDSQSGFVLAAQYGLSQFSGEGNLTKVEESFSYPQAYFAYTSPSFALGVRYQSPSEQEEKLTTLPFSEVVTKTEIGDLSLQLASNLFLVYLVALNFLRKPLPARIF